MANFNSKIINLAIFSPRWKMMYKKKVEKKIYELLSPKKRRNLERTGRLERQMLKYQKRTTSSRRCVSTIPWKALQTLISEMESYKRF